MFPPILTDAKSSFQEPHRDAAPLDPALGQSELPPVVSSDTHLSMFHLNPQGITTQATRAHVDALLHHFQQPTIAGIAQTRLVKRTNILTFTGYKRV